MQGSVTLPEGMSGCEVVALPIRRALNGALGESCRAELSQMGGRRPGEPLCGMIRYWREGMRGYVHFWLFPDAVETRINYAILLREQAEPRPAGSADLAFHAFERRAGAAF
jgi:hypothetical protein